MKKVEHGKTFDRNAANPPAFEIFHNTVTEGYPKHWHTAIEIIMPTRGEYEVVVGKDSYNLKEGDIIMINSGVVHGMRFVSQGERIVMLVEPGCVENQEEMETIFLRLPAIYFKKEDEEDPFYLFLRSQILELVREYDNEGAVMTHRICTGLKELFSEFGRKGFSDANAQNTLHARKLAGRGPKLMIFRFLTATTAVATGTKSLIMAATSSASPTGYSGMYACRLRSFRL
jgi:quercetin dioxygenase-like cupin family protein